MRQVPLSEELFHGAVSLERTDVGIAPWRIPYRECALFPPDGIGGEAKVPAGVRLSFISDTTEVRLAVQEAPEGLKMDCVIDGEWKETIALQEHEREYIFTGLPGRSKRVELYLSQRSRVVISELWIDDSASFTAWEDARPKWITYGSSITQCKDAESPSRTWPALVAQEMDWNLTCLGFSANCHLEPMVARMIRDLPADVISMCLGINVMGQSSLNERTFLAAVIGFIKIVREKHPTTPMLIMSPIYAPDREFHENKVGFHLVQIRQEVEQAVKLLRGAGDRNLHYVNGLDVFGSPYADLLPDNLHPNAEGYKVMADHIYKFMEGIEEIRDAGNRRE